MSDAERAVARMCEAWNAGDLDAAMEVIHPHVEWWMSGTYPDLKDVYRGYDEYREFAREFLGGWEEFTIEPRRIEEGPAGVLLLGALRGRARDGLEVEHRWGYLLQVEEGLIRRARSFPSWESAEEAAG
jgi:ketosteroid isomerase-like protein